MKLSERELDQYHKQCAAFAGFTICSNGEKFCIFSGMSNNLFLFSKTGEDLRMFTYESEKAIRDLYTGYCFANCNEVFLAPYNATEFLAFNIEKEEFRTVDVDLQTEVSSYNHRFLKVIKHCDLLWIIGENTPKIICVDCREDYQKKHVYDYDADLFWTYNHLIMGESIFLPSRTKDVVLEINASSEGVKEHTLCGGEGKGFSDIYSKEDKIFLAASDGELYEWNVALEKIDEIDDVSHGIPSWYSCVVNGKTFRLSAQTPELFIGYSDGKCRQLKMPIGATPLEKGVCFQGIYRDDEGIYLLSRNGRLLFINTMNESVEEIILLSKSKDGIFQEIFNKYAENNMCQEGFSGSLENFISFISNR